VIPARSSATGGATARFLRVAPSRRAAPARRAGPVLAGTLLAGTVLAGPALLAHAAVGAAAPASPGQAADLETILRTVPNAAGFSRHLLHLTEEPHQTGTPRDLELADYVRDRFIEYGLEEVRFHDTPALLPYGRSASLELVEPVARKLRLVEDPYPHDKDSYLYRDKTIVPFHGYARSGVVTAEVVYANSGGPEDFAQLEKMGIDVRGRIVIMRYSEPYSYRGYKVYQAESRGAAGAILYSDPRDDGYARGETYPHGPWGPASHIEWGAIIYDWFGPGEPLTFHWKKRRDGTWKEGPERDRQLPRIPSIPISHEDAAEILSRLGQAPVPAGWQGGLPFTYHVGPGPARVRLAVDNEERIGTIRNVIGIIRGAGEPERWVVTGNHRDAWLHGAVDPGSGTAALLEMARASGSALRAGHRPRRTIVFANWSAEEELLGGSMSWVKDNKEKLLRDGVVYINVDHAASGPDFDGGSTPALADFLEDATRAVNDPDSGGTARDAWAARFPDGTPVVQKIVGATDYTAFQEHIGMSCIDMSFGGPYGVYHSMYDDYFWLSRIGDSGFRYNTTMARLWGIVAWRLANAAVLPMRYSRYARAVAGHIEEIERKAGAGPNPGAPPASGSRPGPGPAIRLDQARAAAGRWESAAVAFESRLDEIMGPDRGGTVGGISPAAARAVNALLLEVERAMTEEEGLKGRPFFKHLIYAPQPTYREEVLPRLFEAIEAGEWDALPRYEGQLVTAFDRAASLLRRARAALNEDIPGEGAGGRRSR
jgi:N-acetylated-alpha-linked acidic dipeptidase